MSEPPDLPLYNNGAPYTHPAKVLTSGMLEVQYENSGVFVTFDCCLRCGEQEDELHCVLWLSCCEKKCVCCKKLTHVGKPCPRMLMTYSEFFTRDFFQAHAGIRGVPSDEDFVDKYLFAATKLLGSKGGVAKAALAAEKAKAKEVEAQQSQAAMAKADKAESEKRTTKRGHHEERDSSPRRKRSRLDCFGHPMALCPSTACSLCRMKGHVSRECPDRKCNSCPEQQHLLDAYPKRKCFKCSKFGHLRRDCPMDKCRNCGEQGHYANNCSWGIKCFRCGNFGHREMQYKEALPIKEESLTQVKEEPHEEHDVEMDETIDDHVNLHEHMKSLQAMMEEQLEHRRLDLARVAEAAEAQAATQRQLMELRTKLAQLEQEVRELQARLAQQEEVVKSPQPKGSGAPKVLELDDEDDVFDYIGKVEEKEDDEYVFKGEITPADH